MKGRRVSFAPDHGLDLETVHVFQRQVGALGGDEAQAPPPLPTPNKTHYLYLPGPVLASKTRHLASTCGARVLPGHTSTNPLTTATTLHAYTRAQEAGQASAEKAAILEQPAVASHPVIVQQLASQPTPDTQDFALGASASPVPDSPPAAGAADATVAMDITGTTDARAPTMDVSIGAGTWELQRFAKRQAEAAAEQQQQQAEPDSASTEGATAAYDVTLNVTAGVPRLDSLLREDEEEEGSGGEQHQREEEEQGGEQRGACRPRCWLGMCA